MLKLAVILALYGSREENYLRVLSTRYLSAHARLYLIFNHGIYLCIQMKQCISDHKFSDVLWVASAVAEMESRWDGIWMQLNSAVEVYDELIAAHSGERHQVNDTVIIALY